MMANYEKDLNELKEQIIKEGNTSVSKRALLERFCEMDEEYNGEPWNLLQILSNINVLIGAEPCGDAVSKQDCINAIENTDCELSPQAWREITNNIMSLPPATPTEKWIPISERLPKPQREIGSEDFSDWVLVSIRINPYQSIVCSAYYCFSEKKWYMERFGCGKIVAWQPLPKPYSKMKMENKP